MSNMTRGLSKKLKNSKAERGIVDKYNKRPKSSKKPDPVEEYLCTELN